MAEAGIDRLSGNSIASLNEALQKHLDGGGFQVMDDLSKKLFPSVFGAIKNCLYKPLRKHPLYREVEFVWTGSTAEGVIFLISIGMGMESLILNSKWIYSVCSETLKSEDQGTVLPYL